MIDFSRSVFIVDGQTEIRAFHNKFLKDFGVKLAIRKGGCNGKEVSADAYVAATLGTILITLRGPFRHIICIIDREQRRQESLVFARAVRKAIFREVLEGTRFHKADLEAKIHVCVPDRMFENWIIADVMGMMVHRSLLKDSAIQSNYDGKSGVAVLGKMLKVKYKKTVHAPMLFSSVAFDRAITNSPSFRAFALTIGYDKSENS